MWLFFECTMTPGHFRALKAFRIFSKYSPERKFMLQRYFIGTASHLSPQTEPTERYKTPKRMKSLIWEFFMAMEGFWGQESVIEPHPSSFRALSDICILILAAHMAVLPVQLSYLKVYIKAYLKVTCLKV